MEKKPREQKQAYEEPEALRAIMQSLSGRKFKLDCGHHITFGSELGNDIIIRNGRHYILLCHDCGQ